MYCFPLTIPHIVVSSKQTIDGELELHVLTPFGQMDILFSLAPPEKDGMHHLNIRVEGDTATWMLTQKLPQSFRKTIIGLIGRIALMHSGQPESSPCELSIRFGEEAEDTRLTGRLMPCSSASAGG